MQLEHTGAPPLCAPVCWFQPDQTDRPFLVVMVSTSSIESSHMAPACQSFLSSKLFKSTLQENIQKTLPSHEVRA